MDTAYGPERMVLVRPTEAHVKDCGGLDGWMPEQVAQARELLWRARVVGTDALRPTLKALVDYFAGQGFNFKGYERTIQVDELIGLTGWGGPLAEFIEVPGLANIQINGADQDVILEYTSGRRDVVRGARISQAWVEHLVTCWLGQRVPRLASELRLPGIVHGSLVGGMRFTYFGPEHARRGMTLQVRMPLPRPSLGELVERRMVTWDAVKWLRAFVQARCNVLVSGGTNAGKTTLVGALLSEVDPMERVGVIESFGEINVDDRPGTVAYELGPDAHEEDMARLVHGNLYNSVQRLVLGEARGGEAAQFIMAMNSGVAGCIATIHAESAEDAPRRLAQCARMSPAMANLPTRDLYHMIAGLGLILVHVEIVPAEHGPRRQVAQIVEVDAALEADFRRYELFRLDAAGELEWVGPSPSPKLWRRLQEQGITGLPTGKAAAAKGTSSKRGR